MKVSPARAAAFDALMRIETENAFSSRILPIFEANLSPNDRSLCHEIALGVLRRKIYLDRTIDELAKGRKIDIEVRIALRIGLFQMMFLDRVPVHSAINESVELVSRAKKRSAKGFVNALLRAYDRETVELTYGNDIEALAISTSHPQRLVERWIAQFGFDQTRLICEANNLTPALSFRLVGDDSEQQETLAQINGLDGLRRSDLVDGCFRGPRMNESLARLADSNRIYFQDEGSQLVANAVIAEGGSRVLDVCAAPGGKTTMIASSPNTSLVAGDVLPSRVQLLWETTVSHRSANVSIVQHDAEAALPFENGTFDTVFVDAPCTGTGTIRHNPEIRYLIKPDDIAQLSEKQLRILKNASELVKQGGKLAYSTCSLEFEENEAVCDGFLRERADFETVSPKVPPAFLTSGGFARTLPYRDNMDGFFIAVFRRK
ncbi:MAG TPA: 16S rRNA (cytosine(967)-C(5))-methyltransferase RsmB [Pyrinomonadaceae bacterium]|nr:16S rRNA (cytosine(967)-C(5))-methyltransferase RsmB [Pyrinomonadaceae bacterium]